MKRASIILLGLMLSSCAPADGAVANQPKEEAQSNPPTLASAPPEAQDYFQPGTTADIIFHKGMLLTMDEAQPAASAIAISGDRILQVGSDNEILSLADAETVLIDLEGMTITPGFIDSHSHRITQRGKWGFSSIAEASQEALSLGWTSLSELAVDEMQLEEITAADAEGELRTRVNAYLTVNQFDGSPLGDWYQSYQPSEQISPYLRLAGLKIFIDFNSGRTLLWAQDDLNQFMSQQQSKGWQVTVKASGIQSHQLALNAYEYALGGESGETYRYRIEHSVAANDSQISRMADHTIIASIQPSFPAVIWNEEDIKNLADEEGITNMFRWRDYSDNGVFLVASCYNPPTWEGSTQNAEYYEDSHLSPIGLIYRSITQIGVGRTPPESWMDQSVLTLDELLPMLTINGAYATFEEGTKGSLTTGKFADLVILSGNPYQTAANDLLQIKVLMTMVGGEAEYCLGGLERFCPGWEITSDSSFSNAQGNWVSTDSDGSSMTLEILKNSDGSYTMLMVDDGARACGDDASGQELLAIEAEGSGMAGGDQLDIIAANGVCAETNQSISFEISFSYDPDSDTLLDSLDNTWQRE